jgi:cation diffusion facilitator CzcD-associated flavoprotein CzcO
MAWKPDHEIAVIGAGLSGVGAGVFLRKHGFEDFVILERASELGGVWRDNTYPGVGVDIPSIVYQFDFHPKTDWTRLFARGAEVKAYIEDVADHFAVRPHIRFDSHVRSRRWCEDRSCWELEVDGTVLTARWVISAIGNFVMPKDPRIPHLEDFGGTLLRSTAWDHRFQHAGKRIAVVGTGASAVQIVPAIAPVVAHLEVFQRTPIWVVPKIDPMLGPRVHALFGRVPRVQRALQRRLTLAFEGLFIKGVINYRRPRVRRTVERITWLLRNVFYRRCVPDPELRRRLTPQYGFGCKRPSLSSTYLRAFNRPNVSLVTERIERVTEDGIRTVDGIDHPVDAIVLATGFVQAHEPDLYLIEPVLGRDGFDLAKFYAENRAMSYEGVTLPGLPNHVFIYGPYGGTGGTWHEIIRFSTMHAIRLMTEARRCGATSVEVRPEAAERYTEYARAHAEQTLLMHNSCGSANSYYFDRNGDTPFFRPSTAAEALAAHTSFPLEDYRWTDSAGHEVPGPRS